MSRTLHVFDDERGTLSIEFYAGMAFVHFVVRQKAKALRYAKRNLPLLRAWLLRMGHEMLYAIVDAGNKERLHFVLRFGFREIDRNQRNVLLGQDC